LRGAGKLLCIKDKFTQLSHYPLNVVDLGYACFFVSLDLILIALCPISFCDFLCLRGPFFAHEAGVGQGKTLTLVGVVVLTEQFADDLRDVVLVHMACFLRSGFIAFAETNVVSLFECTKVCTK
jgi:hypothetical protein